MCKCNLMDFHSSLEVLNIAFKYFWGDLRFWIRLVIRLMIKKKSGGGLASIGIGIGIVSNAVLVSMFIIASSLF